MRIGKIARSSSHIDYVCQVHQAGEVAEAPQPADYAFGTFVRVVAGPGQAIIGLIYNTVLVNPDFGALGPRLSNTQDLAVFSPDYLNEKVTLVGIVAIGAWGPDGLVLHGVPPQTAQIDAVVESLSDEEVRAFHADARVPGTSRSAGSSWGGPALGGVRIGYAPVLIAHGSPLARHLLLNILERLETLCPEACQPLRVLKGNVAWRAAVEPLG